MRHKFNDLFSELLTDKVIVLFYKVDIHLNDLDKNIKASFSNGKDLFKKLFPLAKILIADSNENSESERNSVDKKNSHFSELLYALQYEDLILQKLCHINQVHRSIGSELLSDSAVTKRPNRKFICKILELSSGQIGTIRTEYGNALNQIHSSIDQIKHLIHCADSDNYSTIERETNVGSLNEDKKAVLREKIVAIIDSYNITVSDNNKVEKIIEEAEELLKSFSTDLFIDLEGDHALDKDLLKDIEKLYTMESERKIFKAATLEMEVPFEDKEDVEGSAELF